LCEDEFELLVVIGQIPAPAVPYRLQLDYEIWAAKECPRCSQALNRECGAALSPFLSSLDTNPAKYLNPLSTAAVATG